MRIENEVLLDYSDVLIRPKRSILSSRKDVDLNREFIFRNYSPLLNIDVLPSGYPAGPYVESDFDGIPIMAANMDGVGTFAMATTLAEQGVFTCLVKTYSSDELIEFFNSNSKYKEHIAMSIGIGEYDLKKFKSVHTHVNSN